MAKGVFKWPSESSNSKYRGMDLFDSQRQGRPWRSICHFPHPLHPSPFPKKTRGAFWFSGEKKGFFMHIFFFSPWNRWWILRKIHPHIDVFFCCLCFDSTPKNREIFSILMLGILKDAGKFQIWSAAGFYSIGAGTGGAATKASGRVEWGDSCTQIGRGWRVRSMLLLPLDY